MRNKFQQFSLAVLLPVLFLPPVDALADDKPAQPCKAEPQEQGQQPRTDNSADRSSLADCNGVLHPPTVGDPELVKPAPDVGKMPVIPPGSVPQNSGGQGDAK